MTRLLVELLVVVLLLGVNAFLAASELALVSASKPRLRALSEEGNKSAARALDLAENPGRFLATVQIGITVAGFFAAAVGAVTLTNYVDDGLSDVPVGFIANNAAAIAFVVVTILLSFFSIVYGELVPKTLAVSHADSIALKIAKPIHILSRLMRPIVLLLTGVTNFTLRLLGTDKRSNMPSVTEAEILAMIETAHDEGVVEKSEADLVEEALSFGGIQVRSVMVHRVDVETIPGDMTLHEAMRIFFRTGFSRLPVYRDTPDDIIGVLHIKDCFRLLFDNPNAGAMPAAELVRPAFVVPETRPIDDTLQDLRSQRTHIAIVVDEYGGLAGIVTLEDLIEELVGEISDEFDPGYEPLHEIQPDVFDVDGRLSLLDLLDRLDLSRSALGEVDAESVGGLVTDALERIPVTGDVVTIGPLIMEVKAMDGYRAALVRVTHHHEAAVDDADQPLLDA
ncbi:MAG: hemolysin family protein [Thermomicrobiales bacterium]